MRHHYGLGSESRAPVASLAAETTDALEPGVTPLDRKPSYSMVCELYHQQGDASCFPKKDTAQSCPVALAVTVWTA